MENKRNKANKEDGHKTGETQDQANKKDGKIRRNLLKGNKEGMYSCCEMKE